MPDNRITLRAETLRQALTTAATATQKHNTVPILGQLLISAEGGVLTAIGTNIDERVTASAICKGQLQPCTIDAARAKAILHSLPADAEVTLALAEEGYTATLSTTGMTARLPTLPAKDFPAPRTHKATAQWSLTAGAFRNIFGRCMHAVSEEETRYYLNGVYLHAWDDVDAPELRAAATDGHRLIYISAPMPEGDTPLPMIIHKDAIRQLLKLLAETPDDAALIIKQADLSLRVERPGWAHDSKAIDGTFPDFQRVIPKEAGRGLNVHDVAAFATLIQQARAIGTERSQPVTFRVGERHPFTISARNAEDGDATVQVPPEVAEWAPGADAQVSFHARYLADLCGALPDGFTMHILNDSAPARVTSRGATACLMPMRVD